jgi:hypothetical protein
MITIKQLHRPSYGWANSISKKDKFYVNGVAVPPYVAAKFIRNARCIESNVCRKIYVLGSE